MVKQPKKILSEAKKERIEFLRKLTFKQAADILEELISSRLLKALTRKPKELPLSIANTLKHAKFTR